MNGSSVGYAVIDGEIAELLGMSGAVRLEPVNDETTRVIWTATYQVPADQLDALERRMSDYYRGRIDQLGRAANGTRSYDGGAG